MYRIGLLGICLFAVATAVTSAQQAAPTPARTSGGARAARAEAVAVRPPSPAVLPGTPESAFAVLQGNALDSSDAPLPNAQVRLRDARRGHILGGQVTDTFGAFTFEKLDPGSYVVELLAAESGRVLAASQIVNVNGGETGSTVIRLPTDVTPLGGILGRATRQATAILSAAAAAGVLTNAGTTDVSGETPRLR